MDTPLSLIMASLFLHFHNLYWQILALNTKVLDGWSVPIVALEKKVCQDSNICPNLSSNQKPLRYYVECSSDTRAANTENVFFF